MKIATPLLGITKTSCIIGLKINQDFENNICRHLLNTVNDLIVQVLRFSPNQKSLDSLRLAAVRQTSAISTIFTQTPKPVRAHKDLF